MKSLFSWYDSKENNKDDHSSVSLARNLALGGLLISLFFNGLNYFLDFFIYDKLFLWLSIVIGFSYTLYFTRIRHIAPHLTFLIILIPTVYVNLDVSYSGSGAINYFTIALLLSILIFKTNPVRIFFLCLTLFAFGFAILYEVKVSSQIPVREVLLPYIRLIIANSFLVFGAFRYTYLLEKESAKKDTLIEVIQRQNNELETFSYMLSHDLKQPINNIASFSNLLQKKMSKEPYYGEYAQALNFITQGGNEMKDLVNDILTMSKVRLSEMTLECVNLNVVLAKLTEKMNPFITGNNGVVKVGSLPKLRLNQLYMNLVFQNLIENGLKYNNAEQPTITITSLEEEQHIIRIVDNGFGISPDLQATIFEPFKRGFANYEYEGTGLGLAICTNTISKLGGRIELFQSSPNGSEFRIYFPLE